MIIDMHAHLIHPDTHSQGFWDGWVETAALLANRPQERVRGWLERLFGHRDVSQPGCRVGIRQVLDE